MSGKSIDGSLEEKYADLIRRQEEIKNNKSVIDAELGARQRRLKEYMDQIKAAGYDPDNLKDEISKIENIIELKISTFEVEINAAEKIISPMMEEIQKG